MRELTFIEPGSVEWRDVAEPAVDGPAQALVRPLPAPDGVSPAAIASASDNVSDAYRTVADPLAAEPGAEVLIVAGMAASISLYAVDIARALGAGAVHFLDHDPARLALAESLGAR